MPTDWPDPPLFAHYVLEDPIPLSAMLAVVAALMFFGGGRLGNRRVQLAALLPLLLAGLVWLTAWLVVTDREAILIESRRLIQAATSPFDHVAVEELVDPSFKMTVLSGEAILDSRAALIAAIRRAEKSMTIDSNTLTNHMERMDGENEGRVYMAVFSNTSGQAGKQAAPTRWILTWRRGADGEWRLVEAQWLEVAGRPVRGWMLP